MSAVAFLLLQTGTTYRDLVYSKVGSRELHLDLRLPVDAPKPAPLIVIIHGGGWESGSKDGATNPRLLRKGYAIASIEYRLSGEAIFPAQIQDCKAAIRWLRAHAKDYGLDSQRFGVTGHSAGGHLSSLVGTSGGVKEFEVGQNLDQSSAVQAVCALSGPTDFLQMDQQAVGGGMLKHDNTNSPESRLLGGKITEHPDWVKKANPITYVDPKDPPFCLIHGTKDLTVAPGQATLLQESLAKAHVPVELHFLEGAGHRLGGSDPGRWTEEFFDRQFKDRKPPRS